MNNIRVFVEKKDGFQNEALELLNDFNSNLNLSITSLRVISIYDFFNITAEELEVYANEILADKLCDNYFYELDLANQVYLATELLPSQFCIRQSSTIQCIKLINPSSNTDVVCGNLLIFEGITVEELELVKTYYINTVESREKDLTKISKDQVVEVEDVKSVAGFIDFDFETLQSFLTVNSLSMNFEDLSFIQDYFKQTKRNPTITEILLLDTYWSDHCRHTTFNTVIDNLNFESNIIKNEFEKYLAQKQTLNSNKPVTLMDIATISSKYQRFLGNYQDLEISSEVNSCNFFTKINDEDYLVMFKNETHNHPTEIEPFGGAATCVGGAIRDILASRGYVYQAMRISGSGNPFEKYEHTLANKLPQKKISQVSAHGNSSYGNQIGVATTFVKELVDPSYKAKHLEVGMVVGACKANQVSKLEPQLDDLIILLGGKTGRDGIGGATGSSKVHDDDSVVSSSAEVQKGNAIEERKIQRFFRNRNVAKMIKRCNDLGAGGISVSIGEIANSVHINLNSVPLKDSSLNGTEIALSESQERMSLVIDPANLQAFMQYADEENIEAVVVGTVTNSNRLVMEWNDQVIVDICRDFLSSNGVVQHTNATMSDNYNSKMFKPFNGYTLEKVLADANVASQKGLVEMFDSTVGTSTVLFPFGGKNLLTPTQVSVQKIPVVEGNSDRCTIASYGFNPHLANVSSFHSSMYAVIESIAKIVASGGNYQDIYFSFQEYFERLGSDELKWGKVVSALLGANYALNGFNLAAVGGKDSMSGTFNDINVIPTLISFAICVGDASKVISPEFKALDNYVYLFKHHQLDNGMANTEQLSEMYEEIYSLINDGSIISASAIEYGINEALAKMSFGNDICANISTSLDLNLLDYGSIIVESIKPIDNAILLGKTSKKLVINGYEYNINALKDIWLSKYNSVYKLASNHSNTVIEQTSNKVYSKQIVGQARAFIPVFPGTNCEYDLQKSFIDNGAPCEMAVINNSSKDMLEQSLNIMRDHIDNSNILVLAGGFSQADEPDGSGKYIATILKSEPIKTSIEKLLERGGLILGICNGFQALVKCGLLPSGKFEASTVTLYRNKINRHISTVVNTKVMSVNSPWLKHFSALQVHKVPISHGEGRFVVDDITAKQLFDNGQVAFCYCDDNGKIGTDSAFNPNGSDYAIEGIISPCGQILGKMGHSERYGDNLLKNIYGIEMQNVFKSAIDYFKEEE